MTIKLTCNMGPLGIKMVEVNLDDKLSILMDKLDLEDKTSKFIFGGQTYGISEDLTFKEIGLITNTNLFILNKAIAASKIYKYFNI